MVRDVPRSRDALAQRSARTVRLFRSKRVSAPVVPIQRIPSSALEDRVGRVSRQGLPGLSALMGKPAEGRMSVDEVISARWLRGRSIYCLPRSSNSAGDPILGQGCRSRPGDSGIGMNRCCSLSNLRDRRRTACRTTIVPFSILEGADHAGERRTGKGPWPREGCNESNASLCDRKIAIPPFPELRDNPKDDAGAILIEGDLALLIQWNVKSDGAGLSRSNASSPSGGRHPEVGPICLPPVDLTSLLLRVAGR